MVFWRNNIFYIGFGIGVDIIEILFIFYELCFKVFDCKKCVYLVVIGYL